MQFHFYGSFPHVTLSVFHAFETEQDPVELLGMKAFLCSPFLVQGIGFQPPCPSLSSKGLVQTVANQGREGMQRQGKSS